MSDPIDLETHVIPLEPRKFGLSGGSMMAIVAVICGSLFGAGAATSQLASEDYVDKKAATLDAALLKLADAQIATVQVVGTLATRQDGTDKSMKTMGRLMKIQFIDHIDMQEARSPRAKRRPRSAKSRHIARLLQLDPDNPMAGLELLEATP